MCTSTPPAGTTIGEPRPVGDILRRLCRAAGAPAPRGRVPTPLAWVAGAAVEGFWAATSRRSTPPLTRFLAEQLATAHWFDQRRTRAALGWRPEVPLDEGFDRLAAWYADTGRSLDPAFSRVAELGTGPGHRRPR